MVDIPSRTVVPASASIRWHNCRTTSFASTPARSAIHPSPLLVAGISRGHIFSHRRQRVDPAPPSTFVAPSIRRSSPPAILSGGRRKPGGCARVRNKLVRSEPRVQSEASLPPASLPARGVADVLEGVRPLCRPRAPASQQPPTLHPYPCVLHSYAHRDPLYSSLYARRPRPPSLPSALLSLFPCSLCPGDEPPGFPFPPREGRKGVGVRWQASGCPDGPWEGAGSLRGARHLTSRGYRLRSPAFAARRTRPSGSCVQMNARSRSGALFARARGNAGARCTQDAMLPATRTLRESTLAAGCPETPKRVCSLILGGGSRRMRFVRTYVRIVYRMYVFRIRVLPGPLMQPANQPAPRDVQCSATACEPSSPSP